MKNLKYKVTEFKPLEEIEKNASKIIEIDDDIEYIYSVEYLTKRVPPSVNTPEDWSEKYGDIICKGFARIRKSTLDFFNGKQIIVAYGTNFNKFGGYIQYHGECITPDYNKLKTLIINEWLLK